MTFPTGLPATFQRLVGSNLTAHAAQQIAMAAAPIIAVTALGASVGDVAWIQVAQMLPFLLFSMPAGVLADRMAPKRLMQSGEFIRAATLLFVPVMALFGFLNVPLLMLLCFMGSVGALAYGVAVPTLTQGLVGPAALPVANARLELTRSAAFMGGPAIAGALIAWLGGNEALLSAGALSVLAVGLAATLPELPTPTASGRNFKDELVEGARFVRDEAKLRSALFVTIVFNAAYFILQTAFVPYATHHLQMSPADIGFAFAAYGVGMVVSGLLASPLTRVMTMGQLLTVSPVAGFVAALAMLATLRWPSHGLAAAAFFVLGIGSVLWGMAFTTVRQLVTPNRLMGRVTAINALATYGARPLGAALAGLLGSWLGLEACLVVVVAAFALQLTLYLLSPLPRIGMRASELEGANAVNASAEQENRRL